VKQILVKKLLNLKCRGLQPWAGSRVVKTT